MIPTDNIIFQQKNWTDGYCYNINQFDSEQLKHILHGQSSFWSSYQWFICLENMPENQMLYLYIKDKNKNLIGFMPCQIIKDENAIIFYNLPAWLTKRGIFWKMEYLSEKEKAELSLMQAVLNDNLKSSYPSLMVGHSNSYSAICISDTLGNNDQQIVLQRLFSLLEQIAKSLGCKSISVPYLYKNNTEQIITYIDSLGYSKAQILADAIIPILWKSLEEYLEIFASKRRAAIRREMNVFSKAGFIVHIRTGYEALSNNLALLQASLRKKYGIGTDLTAIYKTYDIFRQNLDSEILVFTVEKNNVSVGFALFFKYKNKLYNRVIGFDYDVLDNDFCYFNLVYYQPILWAIENGINCIHYGPSSYEAKLKRGCILDYAQSFVKFLDHENDINNKIWQMLDYSQNSYRASLDNLLVYK